MVESTLSHEHPLLGSLTGVVRSPSVVQFRALRYAHIPGRFRQSVLLETLSPSERDCAVDGYACPQVPQTQAAFGGRLPGEPERHYSEFDCLTLIISAPKSVLEGNGEGNLLPVMVYVHGGAFSEGVHLGAAYDTARMTDLAIQEGKPVIVVSIHYRVNWQGFLACRDLVEEARSNNEPACNFGLHDQRTAFLWIRNYISGFGGDPDELTAFGESAGSVSLCLHMCSTVPLFKRAIIQSGVPATNPPPADLKVKEEQYTRLLKYCDIDENDPRRLDKLRDIPVQELITAISDLNITAFGPWAEKQFFPIAPNYTNQSDMLEACAWVKEIILGDACFEGFNFSIGLKTVTIEALTAHLESVFGADNAARVMKAYSITPGMDPNLFWRRIMTFGGDMVFSEPIHALAKSLAARSHKKLYRYNIALRNPFPGSIFTEVQGHHFIDLLFLFMTLSERYPTNRHREISTEFARRWITFANGVPPWEEYMADEQAIAVVDFRDGWRTRTRKEDMLVSAESEEGQRRYEAWEIVDSLLLEHGGRAQEILDQLKARSLIALSSDGVN